LRIGDETDPAGLAGRVGGGGRAVADFRRGLHPARKTNHATSASQLSELGKNGDRKWCFRTPLGVRSSVENVYGKDLSAPRRGASLFWVYH
jgi:hypothetical protein